MTLLLVGAAPREFDGLLRFCEKPKKLDWPVDWARSGELRGRPLWMVCNGAGARRAGSAVAVARLACSPDAIVSMGFCGALDPGLRVGDVFVATAIAAAGRLLPVAAPRADFPHTRGVLASIDHVAQNAEEKKALRTAGAAAVEMEAAGVAERAAEWGLPLYCVRSVTDRAEESFANDFNAALRDDGHFDTMQILWAAVRHPGVSFPELIRLRRRCQAAAQKLGEFIADCRF